MASKTVLVWRCKECDKECLRIREESRCICGHRFKEHTKASHKCSNGSCKCAGFFYIIAEGAWILRCRCKHKHIEHDCTNVQHKCIKPGCKGCTGFDSPFVCNCDHPWASHEQVAITITPSLDAMAAFSEVCGGAAGVHRGGIDLHEMPIALTGAGASGALTKPHSAAASSNPPASAQQPQPLAPSRSTNSSSAGQAAGVDKCEAGAAAAPAAAPPSRIPSYGLSRIPSLRQ